MNNPQACAVALRCDLTKLIFDLGHSYALLQVLEDTIEEVEACCPPSPSG